MSIPQNVERIRNAIYGEEVRSAIADSIEEMDNITHYYNHGTLSAGTNLNDIQEDSIYGIASETSYSNKPPIISGFLHTFRFGTNIISQMAHELDFSKVYGRRKLLTQGWSEWEPFNEEEWREHTVLNLGILPNGSNLNDITDNSVWGISSQNSYTNKPSIVSGFIHTFSFSDGILSQIAHELDFSKIYARRLLLNYGWSEWSRLDTPNALQVYNPLSSEKPNVSDLDDVKETGIWGISSLSNYSNCPIPSSGWIECYRFSSSSEIYVQRVWSLDDTSSFTRYYINGVWSEWNSRDGHDIKNSYYAFGDSTTYGQIGGGSGQSKYNYPACVGRLLKMLVHNYGTGGQGLVKDWDGIHTYFINGLDMSDASLITVGWAYNDGPYYSGINFGSYDDISSTTFIGKYFTIMKEFQQKCPTAYIILITGYGYPDGAVGPPVVKPTLAYQFTHKYTFADGQKSVKEMYDTLEAMCHLHGWGCINQAKGTCVNQWNANELIGDQVHLTNEGNLIYGSMIAARVSSLWGNLYKW